MSRLTDSDYIYIYIYIYIYTHTHTYTICFSSAYISTFQHIHLFSRIYCLLPQTHIGFNGWTSMFNLCGFLNCNKSGLILQQKYCFPFQKFLLLRYSKLIYRVRTPLHHWSQVNNIYCPFMLILCEDDLIGHW